MPDYSKGEKFSPKSLPSSISVESVPITIHEHHAEKAGTHYDLRLGGKGDWAIRHFPTTPGEKRLAVRQPTHPLSYYGFTGDITEGYGKGTVSIKHKGVAKIKEWTPSKISFSFEGKDYALINTGGDKWLIIMKNQDLEKQSYHKRLLDRRLLRLMGIQEFTSILKNMGIRKRVRKTPYKKDKVVQGKGVQYRAENPLDHHDVSLGKGVVTRAFKDMVTGKEGF